MEGMEGGRLRCRGGGGGVGAMEDKRLFTHGTQSQRTAREPGACADFSNGSLAPNHVEKKKIRRARVRWGWEGRRVSCGL